MVGEPVDPDPIHASVADLLARHAQSSDAFERVASGRLDETFVDHHSQPQRLGVTVETVGFTQQWEHMTGRG